MRSHVLPLAVVLFVGGTASAAVFPVPHVHLPHLHPQHNATLASALHKAHEERALVDIQLALAEAKAGKVAAAESAAAAAMRELHAAMAHHKHHHHLHKHHHTHLEQALADLKAAEGQFHGGHVGTGEKDLAKAAHQVREALKHHQ